MKSIELKSNTEIVFINGKNVEMAINTIEMIKTVLNSPTQGGIQASDMLIRIKVLDKVEEAEKAGAEFLDLEDNQYNHLKSLVKDSKWSVLSRTVSEFIESF